MTRSYLTERGTRRISKIGIGEAEFKYVGAEVLHVRYSILGGTAHIRHNGQNVTISDPSERNLRAFLRGIGYAQWAS